MEVPLTLRRRDFLSLATGALCATASAQAPRHPNIILVLADDIGYGDLGCYGATRVRTPNLDSVAARGLRFTDAHSSAATCTPSRYSIMTGQYAWRKEGTGILPGDASLILNPNGATLPSTLRGAGYTNGCIGKWHLGLGDGHAPIDWNGEIKPGPLEVGFHESFIIPATGDRVPCVYVENHRVANLDPKDPIQVSYAGPIGDEPTGKARPDLLRMKLSHGHDNTIINGISRIGYMSGGKSARWVDDDIARTITGKAVSFIERHHDHPFFLYFATHDIHVPRVPHRDFVGRSQCGVRCDAVQEFDWSIGQLLDTLRRTGTLDNTLLLITSDNGPVVDDGYADGAVEALNGHKPAGALRGGKYSCYEGGTRMPFLAHWPKKIKPATSDALVCQIDLLASLASLTGRSLPAGAAPDSTNVLPALLGDSPTGRQTLVEQGDGLAIRQEHWKLLPADAKHKAELYDLKEDLGESRNLAESQPGRVQSMTAALDAIRRQH